jgi:hypothetical protein
VGLFPSEGSVEQMAFELAVQKVNLDPALSDDVKLEGRVEIVDVNDGYRTGQKGESHPGPCGRAHAHPATTALHGLDVQLFSRRCPHKTTFILV